MVKVEKDNVVLSVEDKDLAQYESRGYNKIGATKKVAPKDLQKEVNKLTKVNEELTTKVTNIEKEKEDLAKANKELTNKVAELEKKIK